MSSKGMMKRNSFESMVSHKKHRRFLAKTLDKLMLGFWDSEKFGGNLNDILPLVIITMVDHFDVSHILISNDSSCDIMYS